MKLCKYGNMLNERLFEIAYINNLDSDDIVESIKMIINKNYELELLAEFNFEICPEDILKLLDRVSLRNHLQRRYNLIVKKELSEVEIDNN